MQNPFGALQEEEEAKPAGGGKPCSCCGETKPEQAFSKRQWAAKARVRKCTACVDSGAAADGDTPAAPAVPAPASGEAAASPPDVLTLEELALHLATGASAASALVVLGVDPVRAPPCIAHRTRATASVCSTVQFRYSSRCALPLLPVPQPAPSTSTTHRPQTRLSAASCSRRGWLVCRCRAARRRPAASPEAVCFSSECPLTSLS